MKRRNNLLLVLIVLLVIIFLFYILSSVQDEPDPKIEVHFCTFENCSQIIEQQILASSEVDCAFYELTRPGIASALDKKISRVVMDRDEIKNRTKITYYHAAKNSALMHNKFCVLDLNRVITGSFNPTFNDGDDNNLLIIDSKEIASHYETEFRELWDKKNNEESLRTSFGNVEIYFCPEDACSSQVISEIKDAKHSIYFMTFSFTHPEIGTEIVLKHKAGLDVKGVMERSQNSNFSRYYLFSEQNMDVRWDGNSGLVHHKVFIIDNSTVITGSFNPSKNADNRNDENLVIIHDKNISLLFLEEFMRVRAESLKES